MQNLDLTKRKMVHEGPLSWKVNKDKTIGTLTHEYIRLTLKSTINEWQFFKLIFNFFTSIYSVISPMSSFQSCTQSSSRTSWFYYRNRTSVWSWNSTGRIWPVLPTPNTSLAPSSNSTLFWFARWLLVRTQNIFGSVFCIFCRSESLWFSESVLCVIKFLVSNTSTMALRIGNAICKILV